MKFSRTKGFTLIELLVVIAIIGFLATAAIVSLNSARSKARDARRLSDIRQLQSALGLYFDAHQSYPACEGPATLNNDYTCLQILVKDGFISKVPRDPQTGCGYVVCEYYYGAPGWWNRNQSGHYLGFQWPYELQFGLENKNDKAGPGGVKWDYKPGSTRYMYVVHP